LERRLLDARLRGHDNEGLCRPYSHSIMPGGFEVMS
jgi:hypothetical protein